MIALYRTDRGRFALDEAGDWQPSVKATIAVGREPDAPVTYLCGLLNSELLDLWYAVRGKTPWHVRRNYEPLRMNEIPYRRPEGDPRADEIADRVRLIAANRRALLPYRAIAPALTSIAKDPWKTDVPVVEPSPLIGGLPPEGTVSIRLDMRLTSALGPAPLGRPTRRGPHSLVFRRGRQDTGRITGDPPVLDLLQTVLDARTEDPGGVLLPKDLDAFAMLVEARTAEIAELLMEGRRLVEEVERLVCALYAVPDELTDEVIEHAVRRARSAGPENGSEG